jgi:hypothetical protein
MPAQYCPDCYDELDRAIRMRLVEETAENNRGYECPRCECFVALPNLYTTEPDMPGHSDADPGL